jgi:chemotaxis regulatin CheY-phosphate phosphatase CheZ
MAKKLTHQSLLDSEANLRLADNLLAELLEDAPAAPEATLALVLSLENETGGIVGLPRILQRAYGEINNVLEGLRRSRAILERTTLESLQRTQAKLRDVSSATEVAAIDMLDGVDLALRLVDRLEPDGSNLSGETAAAIRAELRDRLHALVIRLQFQDVTAQQLGYASAVLEDVETRMSALVELIDRNLVVDDPSDGGQADELPNLSGLPILDPGPFTDNANARQAVADAIFLENR